VTSQETLIRSTKSSGGATLTDPLPIVEDDMGRIYIGEFGGNEITVLSPLTKCWENDFYSMPFQRTDSGSTSIGSLVYLIGGKDELEHKNTLLIFDIVSKKWDSGPNLPLSYPPVENPCVVSKGAEIFVFGGSTSPFSGFVNNAAKYNTLTREWTMLSDMPTARAVQLVR
jgi:hypothetical protein